ncbi:hypothetical protein LYSHEL_10680 [Lysobacter helvus]|uniref:Uncharacterized protein n=2 Tax=Lysobacteraceae TaxID=32033 RepID=A0ABM7Q421_9GAMM|nr:MULTISPECIES: cytochrome oxidase putative small subunit CydP [Lysobacter]BCT92044.1 hypothetical protein LYSCAS_10680 [Lysobacter caseinilyticus]BCT95197.1 hypothetical protein LYSHEL_10680 [Lysobacter helvus]
MIEAARNTRKSPANAGLFLCAAIRRIVRGVPGPHQHPSADPGAPGWLALLRRHLAAVIAIKLALIALLFFLFFSAAHRPSPGPDDVSDLLHLPS